MKLKQQIEELCTAAGAGGLMEAAETAANWLRPLVDRVTIDPLGNVLGFRTSARSEAPTVLLEAHIDEIGFVVTHIDAQGFVYVAPCGGVDNRTLAAAEVIIWAGAPVYGVFGSVPPHLSEDEQKLPDILSRGIDVGMTEEEAKERIPLGTRVTFAPDFAVLHGTRVSSKALDDRAGVAAVLTALQFIKEKDLPVHVAVAFAVQEELGCRGSMVAAFSAQPTAAIATDVSFAYTPDANRSKCGDLGKGPMLGWAPSLDYRMTCALENLAQREGIPLQHEVMGGDTGTDADSISGARSGVPTALLSIPLRYMHTPVEVVDLQDVEAVGRLMASFLLHGEEIVR